MEIESFLNNVFNNTNKWLEFAEKKNSYVFSFFSLIVIFTPFIGKLATISFLLKVSVCVFYFLYILTIFCTFLSFFPTTKISKTIIDNGNDKKINDGDNLFFWGDIYKYSSSEYISAISRKYKLNIESCSIAPDLVAQIITNSNITRNKMELFKKSVALTFLALIQFTICFSINLFK